LRATRLPGSERPSGNEALFLSELSAVRDEPPWILQG